MKMYGYLLRNHLLLDLITTLLLLMMQLEKLGFIAFRKGMLFIILLGNGKLWLRMREERSLSVLDYIMEVNTLAMSLITTIHTMGFIESRQF